MKKIVLLLSIFILSSCECDIEEDKYGPYPGGKTSPIQLGVIQLERVNAHSS